MMSIEKLSVVWPEWNVVEQIGEGSFGKVYKVVREEHTMTTYAAVKVISIPQSDSEVSSLRSEGLDEEASKTYFEGVVNDFVNEIKLMESMKGISNVVSVEDFKVIPKEDKIGWDIFIRMELLIPFNKYLETNQMSEQDVIKLGTDICTALEHCAQKNIIHRDIKPENIFLSSFGDFKVGDFGIAKELEKTSGALSSKGTYNYMAPEIAAGKQYDSTVDIYSLGLVLYKLLNNNRLPFIDPYATQIQYQDRKNATDKRLAGEIIPPPVNASPQLAEVILAACSYNPAQRFSTPTAFKNALLSVSDTGIRVQHNQAQSKIDLNATTAARPAERIENATVYNANPPVQSFNKPQTPQKKTKEKMSKGKKTKIILITVAISIVVLAITLACLFFTSPAYSVVKNIKSENYSEALSDYNSDVDGNFIQELILKGSLNGYDDKIIENFKNGEIKYDSAVDALETIEKMGVEGAADRISELTTLKDAANAFEKGEQYYKSGDYENAIKEYSKVPKDSNNYEAAQKKLNELYPKYIDTVVETATTYKASKDYAKTISYINAAYDILPESVDTAELDSIKNESLSAYKSYVTDGVSKYTSEGNYADAFTLIDTAISVDDNADFQNMKTTTESKYVSSVKETVQGYLNKQDYISAERTVTEALSVLPNNSDLKTLQSDVEKSKPTYLFDKEPYLVEGVNIYMRNNDMDTKVSTGMWYYDSGFAMYSAGVYYSKGMSITPNSGTQAKVYYNLDGQYSTLTGKVAFDDSYADRIDKEYNINIYTDEVLAGSYTIKKGDFPKNINVNLNKCKKLVIELIRPRGDNSDNPNINLIEFGLKH